MLFNSPEFILAFLPASLAGFFLLGRVAGRDWAMRWLLAASLFFYGWWNAWFVLLLAGSIVANYWCGQRILRLAHAGDRRGAKRWLILGVCFNLGLLGWFKYASFALHTVSAVTGLGVPELDLFLPLAISFFTFQQRRCSRDFSMA
jgi:alginate O-acetyltransferase complex protein AlgI